MALKKNSPAPKARIIFRCSSCGATFLRWQGRCTTCGNWDTLVEERETSSESMGGFGGALGAGSIMGGPAGKPQRLSEVDSKRMQRISSGIPELDEVLGGGIVAGSLMLLGGDPGVGKSTLALELAASCKAKVLYISGEESLHQIKMRADRLKVSENVYVLSETQLDAIAGAISGMNPDLVIIDSIQTMYSDLATGVAGSVSQVSFITQAIMRFAKEKHVSFLLVGHVTKEGYLAGPKTLEHMVDTVLYLEGERFASFRILRATKNRFGTSNEVAVFEMTSSGIHPVSNPSELFLQQDGGQVSGNCVASIMEGSRALLLEMQALTSKTSFGYPKRTASGFDYNRLQLISAIISKRVGVDLADQDIYVNVVGGMKVDDPAADLAVALAIISSVKNIKLGNIAVIGELGLSGEIRAVGNLEKRIKEAEKLGFEKIVVPAGAKATSKSAELVRVRSLSDALRLIA